MNKKRDNLVAVYGTLRKGFGNYNAFLKDKSNFVKEYKLKNYKMYDVAAGGFPGVVWSPDDNDEIVIELYYVDDDTLKRLDMLEGYMDYDKDNSMYINHTVKVDEDDDAILYVWNDFVVEKTRIKNGDWKDYKKKLLKNN